MQNQHKREVISTQKMSYKYNKDQSYGNSPGMRVNIRVQKLRQRICTFHIVQELCESRGGHPGLSVLTSLMVSLDVKLC